MCDISKENISVVALSEDSNGDVNKNTENGDTKVIADSNTSNGRDPRSSATNCLLLSRDDAYL